MAAGGDVSALIRGHQLRPRPSRLLTEVRSYLPGIFDGDLCAVVADTGGAGRCRAASQELVERMGRGRTIFLDFEMDELGDDRLWYECRHYPLPRWTRCYWRAFDDIADTGHVVAEIDGYYVDLTAQQFRRRLPFPMLVPVGTP